MRDVAWGGLNNHLAFRERRFKASCHQHIVYIGAYGISFMLGRCSSQVSLLPILVLVLASYTRIHASSFSSSSAATATPPPPSPPGLFPTPCTFRVSVFPPFRLSVPALTRATRVASFARPPQHLHMPAPERRMHKSSRARSSTRTRTFHALRYCTPQDEVCTPPRIRVHPSPSKRLHPEQKSAPRATTSPKLMPRARHLPQRKHLEESN